MSDSDQATMSGVAIIGMAGRFPGARHLDEFWKNLRDGVESISFFSAEELLEAGVPDRFLEDREYVKARPVLNGVDLFDAAFFDMTPKEAAVTDPQHRVFLGCCWEALESSGYSADQFEGLIGVYAGSGMNTYMMRNIAANRKLAAELGSLQVIISNEKDYLTSRVAYKLDLGGPAVSVQSACSTSLVAVCLACQGLLDYQCDLALAGGVNVGVPQVSGYFHQEGGILSPDGHCRAFDARAAGTVFGNGAGVVVLKRMEDAVADGDEIAAVVRGFAVNNDGARKIGFTAPGVEGQVRVVSEALSMAEVDPETVSYVETHGTATPLGDPIEIEALTQVFRKATAKKGFCAIGSVKSNVGHLNSAAGVTGLIKTALALKHRSIPPSLYFEEPNPQIDFAASPFFVNRTLREWQPASGPRRAGVSSFGIGGTNAHVVLEQAPAPAASGPSRPWQLLVLSAKTSSALDAVTGNLLAHCREHPKLDLADVAHTLQRGRKAFAHRRTLVCRDLDDATEVLASRDRERLRSHFEEPDKRPIAFLFPGQGAQYAGLGSELYGREETFRDAIDRCSELLEPHLGLDLRSVLYAGDRQSAGQRLEQTVLAQPALFTVEYAAAELWREWGIRPQAMIGHSIGEYVAACLAGVFELEDALALVAARGRLMQAMPPGALLSVSVPEAQLGPLLGPELALASVNAPQLCTVSGPAEAVTALEQELEKRGSKYRRVHTSHAFHSAMMDPILDEFRAEVAKLRLRAPRIPFVSNLTGTWITAEEATDPGYWTRHLRRTVRFSAGLGELLEEPKRILLTVGPARTLDTFSKHHPDLTREHLVLASLPHARAAGSDTAWALDTLGRLWLAGVEVDWRGFSARETRRRLPLPTYPFEPRRHWLESHPDASAEETAGREASPHAPDGRASHAGDPSDRAPGTEIEQRLVEIWQGLLGHASVGLHEDFFELGGHSLLALQVMSQVRDAFHVDLSLSTIFDAPTVAKFAAAVGEHMAEPPAGDGSDVWPVVEPDPAARFQPFPLTDVQHAYWIGRGDAIELGQVATHVYTETETEEIEPARLSLALRRLIERHEMLRAVVRTDGRQQILEQVPPYELEVRDLREESSPAVAAELESLRRRMSHQVLPADRWPLFEIRASRLGERRYRYHLSFDFLIGDAWSLRLLRSELFQLYAEPEKALPPLELSFRDYVLAEQALSRTEIFERSLEYWRGRLDSLPPAPQLPLARHPSTIEKPRFVRRVQRLEKKLWERLKARAQRAGMTSSGIVLAAYAEVLATWSKSRVFTITLTLFNRLGFHPQVHEVVGDFTSLTLLAADCRGSVPFESRAQALQQALWRNLDHRIVSSVRVLRELTRRRGGERPNMPVVFTSLLNFSSATIKDEPRRDEPRRAEPRRAEPRRAEPRRAEPRRAEQVYSISQTPQVWLDHQAAEEAGDLVLYWDAVEEIFPPGLLDTMFEAYGRLLRYLAEDEDAWQQCSLGLSTPALGADRPAEAPVPPTQLQTLFTQRVAEAGQRPAVIAARRILTYAELYRLSNQVGNRLAELGEMPGRLVAVVMEKGWQQIAGVVGVLASGAAYLPIHPALPAERRRWLLERGRVRVAVTRSREDRELEWPEGIRRLCIDSDEVSSASPGPRQLVQGPEDLAYVIFTSGSTGLPKGVMIDHRGAVNTILDIDRRFGVRPEDRVFALSALDFDLSVYDIFGLLAAGGAVVVPEARDHRDPEAWIERMERDQVTIWNTVPALMEMLVTWLEGQGRSLPDSLRCVLLSGDWIPTSLPDRIRELAPRAEVISLGGATEVSIWSILYPVGNVEPTWQSIPYGKAMTNQSVQVLDEDLTPRPVWVPGELYIGGLGLAKGYWRDEEKTRAAFLSHPDSGERLYRTGDLGRLLPDGNIEFLGREDFQVKVGGHRIELGEIEATLAGLPEVKEAVVVARQDTSRQKRLVAYVIPAERDRPQEHAGIVAAPLADDALWQSLPSAARRLCDKRPAAPSAGSAEASLTLLARGYICSALLQMGVFSRAAERHSEAELVEEKGISRHYRLLLRRWLEILVDAGLLVRSGDVYENPAPLPAGEQDDAWRQIQRHGLVVDAVGDIIRRSGENLASMLTGRVEALEIFFPGGDSSDAETFYESAHGIHSLSAAILAAAVEGWPPERPLRVLEIGAGTGGTTSSLLPLLPADRTRYTYTDISLFFIQKARDKFKAYDFLEYETLNVEHHPLDQGFQAQSYDIVVATNVIHGTRNLNQALKHVQCLLAPCGLLLLEEATRWEDIFDVTIGLIEGLNRFDDEWREGVPFISPVVWERALRHNGFEGFDYFPGTLDVKGHVMIARSPTLENLRLPAWLSQEQLRSYVEKRLPAYMVPVGFVVLEAFPLTPTGKVDRRSLPAPEQLSVASQESYVAPGNRMEEQLAGIWSEILEVENVGILDNFFALGGDSILSVKIVARARELGLELSSRDIFEHQSIAELAAVATVVPSPPPEEDAAAEPAEHEGAEDESAVDFPLAGIDQEQLLEALALVEFEE